MSQRFRVISLGIAIAAVALVGCTTATPTAVNPEETAVAPAEAAAPTDTSTVAPTATEPSSPLPTPEQASPLPTPEGAEPTSTAEASAGSIWTADGIISEGEYGSQADFGDIRIWWGNDESSLYLAMEGDTTGWVSVGINPQQGMQGADFLFGFVADGEARLWDAWGTAPTGPNHPPDEDLGGTDDITDFAGVEEDGITRFELRVPLDSGDAYDHSLQPGQTYPVIVAIGPQDDFNAYHSRYDQGEISID